MTPHEELIKRKADLDNEISGLLLNINEDEDAFRQRTVRAHSAAAYYREALREAAKHVNAEKSEAYIESAKESIMAVTHFVGFLNSHRHRHLTGD